MHQIDDDSPLHNYDAAQLLEHDPHLLVGIGGHDATLAAQVVATKGYLRPRSCSACAMRMYFHSMPRATRLPTFRP